MKNYICVGKLCSAKGLDGAIKLISYCEDYKSLLTYNLLLEKEIPISIKSIKAKGNALVARIQDVSHINQLEPFLNKNIYINRDDLEDIDEEDSFYIEDLKHLVIKDSKSDAEIGTVHNVVNFGAQDIIVAAIPYEDTIKHSYISFNKASIPEVNVSKGYIVINSEFLNEE